MFGCLIILRINEYVLAEVRVISKEQNPKRASTDPQGPANGKDRVMRGGSFCVKASSVRSALRNSGSPNFQSHDLGFRIAQTIGP